MANLPGAALLFGWPAECLYGARVALAQFALTWNWQGSVVSLGTALLLLPLRRRVLDLVAFIIPLGWLGAAPLYIFDQISTCTMAAVISIPSAAIALLSRIDPDIQKV